MSQVLQFRQGFIKFFHLAIVLFSKIAVHYLTQAVPTMINFGHRLHFSGSRCGHCCPLGGTSHNSPYHYYIHILHLPPFHTHYPLPHSHIITHHSPLSPPLLKQQQYQNISISIGIYPHLTPSSIQIHWTRRGKDTWGLATADK